MSETSSQLAVSAFQGINTLPLLKQVGVMVGIAASVALGVYVVLWSQEPEYSPLYSKLSETDMSEIANILNQNDMKYKLDISSNTILVNKKDMYQARLKVAASGLPESSTSGFDQLDKNQSFGTSQFMEQARYKRALEGEIAKTITSIRAVKSARVHLAIPKESAFVRSRKKGKASVFLDLYSGYSLSHDQVAAVSYLVSSSVPNVDSNDVTVVDQKGRLLTDGSGTTAAVTRQFQYTKSLEEHYQKRILTLLEPIVGFGNVRAEVSADIDFTMAEKTQEKYNPDFPAVRAEEIRENIRMSGNQQASGVPGAASNLRSGEASEAGAGVQDKKVIKRYELDKTISHTQQMQGRLQRLSAAVLLDNKIETAADGSTQNVPWKDEEIDQLTTLIKDAIGFNLGRGDVVSITNTGFVKPDDIEQIESTPIWQEAWVIQLAKQSMAGIFILLLVFFVLRPFMKTAAANSVSAAKEGANSGDDGVAGQNALDAPAGSSNQMLQLPNSQQLQGFPVPNLSTYEDQLEVAKSIVNEDPARVAQVVKTWMKEDE